MSNNYNDDNYVHLHYNLAHDDNHGAIDDYNEHYHHHHGPGVNDILIHNHDDWADHEHIVSRHYDNDTLINYYGPANHSHYDEHSPRDYNHRSDDNDDTHTAQHGGTNRYPGGAWFGCPCAWCAHHQSNP